MEATILLWTLILMRVSGFILINPIFSRKGIPGIVKAGIIMSLSLFLISYSGDETIVIGGFVEYSFLLLKEFVIGYCIGFIVSLFQYIIIYAGGIIDFMMGLSMATIFDPQSNSSMALTATLLNYMFVLIFFAIDGHIALFRLLIVMKEALPYGSFGLNPGIYPMMLELFAQCTLLGVQMAFPIIALELLAEAGVGILMRAIPQINIFAINIQMKIIVGLLAVLFLVGPFGDFIKKILLMMMDQINHLVSLM